MSDFGQKPFLLKQPDGDEVERSIELLDKVLSEFEDPESLPHIEPDSPSQGHQSEDDGYMSMNGKSRVSATINVENDSNNLKIKKLANEAKLCNDILNIVEHNEVIPLQTTLPKTRPSNAIPSKYASLPCSTPPRLMNNTTGEEFFMGSNRTILGIGISAVHDAVLRGVAKIPESIVNEHPITIYPGRASPPRKVPPRTLPGLIERHRDVCRKSIDSTNSPQEPPSFVTDGLLIIKSNQSNRPGFELEDQSKVYNVNNNSIDIPNENAIIFNNSINIEPCTSKISKKESNGCDENDFSDDSLEDASLPPPAPTQPLVPPTPSLSAPATPNKRGSIAWEININDDIEIQNTKTAVKPVGSSIVTGSQVSIASTPGNSITSTDHTYSSDWPDPPEQPVCSTEDEAGSLFTDSEDVISLKTINNMVPNGTYVIRKGRNHRHPLFDVDLFDKIGPPEASDVSCKHSPVEISDGVDDTSPPPPSPPPAAQLHMPQYRHSIDLALPSPPQHSVHSPRSRLSLNLHLPTSENSDYLHLNNAKNNANNFISSPRHSDYKLFCSKLDGLSITEKGNNNNNNNVMHVIDKTTIEEDSDSLNKSNEDLVRVSSLPIMPATVTVPTNNNEALSTPRRDLAPPIEEDEEQDSESQRVAPLRQIENNISALLRGDIAVARVGEMPAPRRPVGFRAGVHKSESAKEMLLSQNMFGPLPPSPPTSSPDETDGFPPLPPSPLEENVDNFNNTMLSDSIGYKVSSQGRNVKLDARYRDTLDHPPAIPPHRGVPPTLNTLKTRSMDAGFTKCYKNSNVSMSPHTPGTLPDLPASSSSRRRIMSGAFPKRAAQSPREERRLQTSCSLPETPIFARGCDVPRTPHRRTQEMPSCGGGSRTAPRQVNGLNSSIVGIAGSTLNGRPQRTIHQALASTELLRLTGGPARGWYPKQRQQRPVSTENLDRINLQGSSRAWDGTGSNSRKPLTLPPNLSPNFFNKSPREALRRVTSLLIRKGNNGKDSSKKEKEKEKEMIGATLHRSFDAGVPHQNNTHKKKGFFKSFWKKSKHYSLDQ